MNYYQEVSLLPDADISLSFIWENVFQQVHIALVENKGDDNNSHVAVSFPQYGHREFPFGRQLRLFAKQEDQLQQLDLPQWLNRLSDYTHIKTIQPTPKDVTYVSFQRENVKSPKRIEKAMQKKAALWAKKSGRPLADCLADLEKTKPTGSCDLPFVYLYSQQTKQHAPDNNPRFPLFIKMTVENNAQTGEFDCYGLSAKRNHRDNKGTVPQFA